MQDLEAFALIETSLEEHVFRIAIRVGSSLKSGGGPSSQSLQECRDAHADWQASRAVSGVAARRSPDWQMREPVSSDRLTELVRVVAKIAADLVMLTDRTPPAETDVDARFAEALVKRN